MIRKRSFVNLFLALFVLTLNAFAQDTVKVMYYNLLNFPDNTPNRCDTLRKILHHAKPDIFVVNELQSLYGANLILNQSLNTFGINNYQKATFVDGPDTDNLLYYNSNLFSLKSQKQLSTALRDISEYVVYYKPSAQLGDTVFLHIYSMHLKASAGQANEQQRQQEAAVLKNYLQQNNLNTNIIAGGDLNLYTSTEPAYTTLTSTGTPLYDPINTPGAWGGNTQFTVYHTQSVRISSYLGGSGGGMNDRFDHILISGDITVGLNKVKYINNSYWAYGQDGNRFNNELITPQNISLPDSVIKAMYNMSDHLPVFMKIYIDPLLSQIKPSFKEKVGLRLYPNPTNGKSIIYTNNILLMNEIYCSNILGKVVYPIIEKDSDSILIDFSALPKGLYLLQIGKSYTKIVVE